MADEPIKRRAYLNVPVTKEFKDMMARQQRAIEAKRKRKADLGKARMDFRKDEESRGVTMFGKLVEEVRASLKESGVKKLRLRRQMVRAGLPVYQKIGGQRVDLDPVMTTPKARAAEKRLMTKAKPE